MQLAADDLPITRTAPESRAVDEVTNIFSVSWFDAHDVLSVIDSHKGELKIKKKRGFLRTHYEVTGSQEAVVRLANDLRVWSRASY